MRCISFFRRQTVKLAYDRGLVVEPSGAAALAAFLTGKVNILYLVLVPSTLLSKGLKNYTLILL